MHCLAIQRGRIDSPTYPRQSRAGLRGATTQALLQELLVTLVGIPPASIRSCAGTGIVADIVGTGKAAKGSGSGTPRVLALRADMDALRMTEGNRKEWTVVCKVDKVNTAGQIRLS